MIDHGIDNTTEALHAVLWIDLAYQGKNDAAEGLPRVGEGG